MPTLAQAFSDQPSEAVDKAGDMALLIDWGVDKLITHRPDLPRDVMAKNAFPLPKGDSRRALSSGRAWALPSSVPSRKQLT